MGYFSRLNYSVQLDEAPPLPATQEPKVKPVPAQPAATGSADAAASPAADLATTPEPKPAADPAEKAAAAPASAPENTPTPPVVKLDAPADDTAARKTHEAAEAKRKAEWEAKQAQKKAARQEQLDRIKSMTDADLLAASLSRVSTDTERLTRRNMKEAVAEHIQAKCREDTAFALLVMDPDRSMINCFKYINRRAQAYAEQEMKDNGIDRTGVYGLDVPDGLCFQWAEDYFNDPDAKEDHTGEAKFVPKHYIPKSSGSKSAAKPKPKPKKEAPKPATKPKSQPSVDGQLSFMGAVG